MPEITVGPLRPLQFSEGDMWVDKGSGDLQIAARNGGRAAFFRALLSGLANGGIGYRTGAGGTVTQATNKQTGVTINRPSGQITMNNEALAAAAETTFEVTNSVVAATDVVVVNIASVGTAGSYLVTVSAVAAGTFKITLSNVSAGSLSEAIVLNFAVIKGASA